MRRIVPGVAQSGSARCDTSRHTGFKEGWYRFSFPEAPFAKIPTTPPLLENRQYDMKSCGTHGVSWVDASYPSVGEPPKNVTIKFAWKSNEAWGYTLYKRKNCCLQKQEQWSDCVLSLLPQANTWMSFGILCNVDISSHAMHILSLGPPMIKCL